MIRERIQRHRFHEVASRGLRWLWTNRDYFRIRGVSRMSDAAMQAKPLLELMFLLDVLRKRDIQNPVLGKLRDFCARAVTDLEWHQALAFDPSNAAIANLLYPFCETERIPLPFERDYFESLLRARFFDATDRVPFRQMDYLHGLTAMRMSGVDTDMLPWFHSTAFGRRQTVTRYSVGDLYSLTHAAFYLSDLGGKPDTPLLDPETRERLHDELVRLAAVMVRGDHLDVLAELLLCCLMCRVDLRGDRKPLFEAALSFVQSSVRRDGTLPPSLAPGPSREGADNFAYLYHTCLVSVLLFSFLAKGVA